MGNFSRQSELYDPSIQTHYPVVIGAGATGSWVSLFLTKLGIKGVLVIDNDIIEAHNLPNQFYKKGQEGSYKVNALNKNLQEYKEDYTAIEFYRDRYGEGNSIDNAVFIDSEASPMFCLVDSMAARKAIYNLAKSKNIKTYIETRMGLTGYRIYMIDTTDKVQCEMYEKTLYSDEDAEVSACGTSQSIVSTAVQCASHAIGLWLAKINNAEYVPNEVLVDVHSSLLISKQFKNKEE